MLNILKQVKPIPLFLISQNNFITSLMKIILVLFLIVQPLKVEGLGFSDWKSTTPGGNTGNNFGGYNIEFFIQGKHIDSVQQFYFYKNHILGIQGVNKLDITGYFIIDEWNNKIYKYKNENIWKSQIQKKSLNPVIWTRWYTSNWFELDDWKILFLFGFFVSIPLLVLYIFFLIKAIKIERFKFFKPYTTSWSVITFLIFLEVILNLYPQSI